MERVEGSRRWLWLVEFSRDRAGMGIKGVAGLLPAEGIDPQSPGPLGAAQQKDSSWWPCKLSPCRDRWPNFYQGGGVPQCLGWGISALGEAPPSEECSSSTGVGVGFLLVQEEEQFVKSNPSSSPPPA